MKRASSTKKTTFPSETKKSKNVTELERKLNQLEKGRLTNGAFRIEKRTCIQDKEKKENVIIVYPKTQKDLVELARMTLDDSISILLQDTEYSLTDYVDDTKHVTVYSNLQELELIEEIRSRRSKARKPKDEIGEEVPATSEERETAMENEMKKKYGHCPIITIEKFSNWDGSQQTKRVLAARPKNLKEIQTLIRHAQDKKLKIRCAGRKHSWAPLFADENQMCIYFTNLQSDYPDGKKIRFADASRTEVDVMAGASNKELKQFQLDNQVNLPCNVILTVVQFVGVATTGCHLTIPLILQVQGASCYLLCNALRCFIEDVTATDYMYISNQNGDKLFGIIKGLGVGWDCKSPSDYLTRMRVVDSSGKMKIYTVENMEQMKALQASFGLFGVVYDVRVKMEPQVKVKTQTVYRKVEEIFYNADNLKKIVEDNWSVEIFWFPFNSFPLSPFEPKREEALIRVINSTSDNNPTQPNSYYVRQELLDLVTAEALGIKIDLLGDTLTRFSQWLSFLVLKNILYPAGTMYQELPRAVHFREYVELEPVHDMEFAFDFNGDYQKICKIVQVVIDMSKKYEQQGKYPFNLTLEMRFMAYSDVYLCPAVIGRPEDGGSGHVFFVEVLSVDGTRGWEEFCIELAKEWLDLGGIPHLAKEWEFIPGIQNKIRKGLGDNVEKFKTELKESGADPDSMFVNSGLKKLIFDS